MSTTFKLYKKFDDIKMDVCCNIVSQILEEVNTPSFNNYLSKEVELSANLIGEFINKKLITKNSLRMIMRVI